MATAEDVVPLSEAETQPLEAEAVLNRTPSAHHLTPLQKGAPHIPSPRNSSSDPLTPQPANPPLGGALKRPHGSALRPDSSQQNEQSPDSPQTRDESDGLLTATTGVPETPVAGKKGVQFSRDTPDVEQDPEKDRSRPPSL